MRPVKPHSQPFKEYSKPLGASLSPTTSGRTKAQKSNHNKQAIEETPTLIIENHMAKLKSELDKWISMPDRDYLDLVEDHIMMTALCAAGIEQLPIYKSAQSILKNNHIEVHLKPIKPQYK